MRRYRLYRGIRVLATVYSKEIPPSRLQHVTTETTNYITFHLANYSQCSSWLYLTFFSACFVASERRFPLKKFIPNSLLIFWDCVWWKKTKEREWEGGIGRQELQGDGRRRAWLLFSELLLLGPASAGVSGRAQPHYAASLWHVPPRRFLPSCGVCFPPEGRKEAHTD